MQTFLPYPDFARSARVLDRKRLGKQRVETLQILRAIELPDYGWATHPAVRMWRGFVPALVEYGLENCREWTRRGYADSVAEQLVAWVGPHICGRCYEVSPDVVRQLTLRLGDGGQQHAEARHRAADRAGPDVAPDGTADGDRVDTEMRMKSMILDGDNRVAKVGGDAIQRDVPAMFFERNVAHAARWPRRT